MLTLEESYKILGTKPGVPPDELKQAYRKMAKAWHPDLFQHSPAHSRIAEEKLRLIIKAYSIISDSRKNEQPSTDDKTGADFRKCSAPNCGGRIGPDQRCLLCMKEWKVRSDGNGQPHSTGRGPEKLINCSHCGRLNRVDQHDDLRQCVCWECRKHLLNPASIKALAKRPSKSNGNKTFKFLGLKIPTLDYLGFLGFCFIIFSFVAVACVGTVLMLVGGVNALMPYYYLLLR